MLPGVDGRGRNFENLRHLSGIEAQLFALGAKAGGAKALDYRLAGFRGTAAAWASGLAQLLDLLLKGDDGSLERSVFCPQANRDPAYGVQLPVGLLA